MKNYIPSILFNLLLLILNSNVVYSQIQKSDFQYDISADKPYGAYNPEAPEQLLDFEPLIGSCQCKSVQRNQDGSWQDTTLMAWEFRYIFDGKAVQDITWKEDGSHTSSIRQFNPDSSAWAVTYFNSVNPTLSPPTWTGGKTGSGDLVFTRPQQAPNGMDGASRLTFTDISEEEFNWIGEWISEDGSVVYPFWRIFCVKEG